MFSALRFVLVITAVPAAKSLRCLSGWSDSSREIPETRINDGYCDCPVDGADEVDTGACSGSVEGGWAGVRVIGSEVPPSSSKFQCPQQKSLLLPLSQIGDGLCDCCDGADEPPSSNCDDICDEVLAAERAARQKAKAGFTAGSKRREEEINLFAKMVEETVVKIDVLTKSDIPKLEGQVNSFNSQIRESKLKFATDRFTAVKQTQSSLGYLSDILSADEIVSLIITTCQLAGEIANSDGLMNRSANQKSCIPLRLAGLDAGTMWENESFSDYSASIRYLDVDNEHSMEEFATLLDKNSGQDENISFGKDDSTSHNVRSNERRDHDRHHVHDDDNPTDDDYHGDDDMYPYEADDDYSGEYPGHKDPGDKEEEEETVAENAEDEAESETSDSPGASDEPEEKSREHVVKESVESTSVYMSRAAFKARAQEIIENIDNVRKDDDAEQEAETNGDTEGEGNGEYTTQDDSESTPVDPMAIQMVSGLLSSRLSQLERGGDFATSAKILLDAMLTQEDIEGKKRDLINLAIGTIYHSKLGAGDVAELFYKLLPEFRTDGDSEETCSSPYSNMCPPKTVERESIPLPPEAIVSAAGVLCKERSTASISCSGGESSNTESIEGIPTDIPDGYYGYFPPKTRGSDDLINIYFSPLDTLDPSRMQTSQLEEEKASREGQLNDARKNLRKFQDQIGGKEDQKFGVDGELYGIRDSCHKVESGKYEYEVCIFGKATQRDKGQTGGGTNLGSWSGMKKDDSTGELVLIWNKGTKCWNGPQRSATVFLTCGAESKVLSADEPRTCEYEMKMESHIACDDKFRDSHGL